MKPISLEMHAFGPYARSQRLDFRELGDRSLFLIHGPTGAGKSTILDAICFALYNETSGKERDGGQMRSDHASPDVRTRVVFEFAIGNDIYGIDRTPKYDALREDGEAYRTVQHSVEMWRRNGVGENELIASRVGTVGDQVERLLGLRADQFRQVVVLPQGRFRELLTASSLEREKIFSTLFQTDHYRLIQDRLKERARLIRVELERQSQQRQTILQMAEVESQEELSAKIAGIEKQIADLTDRRRKQEAAVEAARTLLEQARETDRKLREVRDAHDLVDELARQREVIDQDRTRLDRARKAAQLSEAERNLKARIDEAETSEKARAELDRQVVEAREKLGEAEQEKQAADELQPQIAALVEQQRTLAGLRPRVEHLSETETQLNDAREKVAESGAAHQRAVEAQQEAASQLKTAQQQLQSAHLQQSNLGGLDATLQSIKRVASQRKQLEDLQTELSGALTEQEKASTARVMATDNLRKAEQSLEELERAWRDGQAAVLARNLEDEQPCPVCGSFHHPSPATSDDEIPDDDQLEQHREAVRTAGNNLRHADNNKVKLDEQVRTLTFQVDDLREELGDVVEIPAADLEQQASDAEHQLMVARAEAGQITEVSQQVDDLDARAAALQRQVDEAIETRNQARLVENSENTSHEAALREVPEEHRSLEALDAAIDATKAEIERLNERVEAADKALDDARSSHTNLAGRLDSARKEAEQDRERANDAADEFARRRLEQGFADDQAYLDARLPVEQVDQLETAIKEFDESVSIARDRLATAEKNAEGLQQPDLAALQSESEAAQAEQTVIINQLAAHDSQRSRLARASSQIDQIRGEIERLDSEYSVAEYLSGVANGEAAYSRHRISFERFVLGTFLDEVLVVATEKLRTMTSGRYQLLRKLYGSDGRRGAGLDLEVEDAYTGVARDVSTLSGGEGFLAALAMALGLSEVVQNRAGGIRLQTLFVDEGFGSLDPDALDRSLNTLIEMHHGRLVGIISHVPELQERIDARLSVEAGKNGSRARFSL